MAGFRPHLLFTLHGTNLREKAVKEGRKGMDGRKRERGDGREGGKGVKGGRGGWKRVKGGRDREGERRDDKQE